VNLLLHAANCILLLKLARRYLSPLAAGCVAAIFALHPLETEAVTYVFARSTLLSTHFALWTLWFYASGRWVASALMFAVSLLAKEETVALPAFLLLLDLFERRRPRLGYYALLGGFAAAAAGRLFYLIHTAPFDPGVGRVRGVSAMTYLLTQGRVLWIYLRLLVAPVDLNLDREIAVSTSLLSPRTTLIAWLALAALVAALLWFAWRKQPAAMWTLGFFVLIAPSSSIVAQADLIFEHRTYLPMICLAMALGFLFDRLPPSWLLAGLALLIPLMLAGDISRNADWRDEKAFWNDIVKKSPHKARAYMGLARAYMNDDPAKTRELLRRGLELDPNSAEMHTNYGAVLLGARQPAEALEHFQRAMALTHESADNWNNIGAAYYSLGRFDESMAAYRGALKLDPCNYNAHRNLVMLYANQSQPEAAYQAGNVPASCHLIPDQAAELEKYRRQVGREPPK
jgi:tetratricopeptide (TPR) repeat protein